MLDRNKKGKDGDKIYNGAQRKIKHTYNGKIYFAVAAYSNIMS